MRDIFILFFAKNIFALIFDCHNGRNGLDAEKSEIKNADNWESFYPSKSIDIERVYQVGFPIPFHD